MLKSYEIFQQCNLLLVILNANSVLLSHQKIMHCNGVMTVACQQHSQGGNDVARKL